MTTRAMTIPVPSRTWTLLTEPTGGATAVSLQVRDSGRRVYLQGSASNTLPTNDPILAPAAEWLYDPRQGELAVTLANLFPDITAIHLFAWCDGPAQVTVRHA